MAQTTDQITALKAATESMTLLVAAVIVHDLEARRVVLLRCGPKAKFAQGMWDLPVGKSEPGEPITQTAVRELFEETGLVVSAADLRLAHVIHGARGIEAPNGFLTLVFSAHSWSCNLINGEPEKHSEVAWVPPTMSRRTSCPPRGLLCSATSGTAPASRSILGRPTPCGSKQ